MGLADSVSVERMLISGCKVQAFDTIPTTPLPSNEISSNVMRVRKPRLMTSTDRGFGHFVLG